MELTFDFQNLGDAIDSAEVTSAWFTSGGEDVAEFEITPSEFGPFDAGEFVSLPATKVVGSLFPSAGCESLACGGKYDVAITFDVDGSEVPTSVSVTVECVY